MATSTDTDDIRVTDAELVAWQRLAELRSHGHNLHAEVSVATYNRRFGTDLGAWEAVWHDATRRLNNRQAA